MKRVSNNLQVKCLESFSSAVATTEKYSGEETVIHAVHTSWGSSGLPRGSQHPPIFSKEPSPSLLRARPALIDLFACLGGAWSTTSRRRPRRRRAQRKGSHPGAAGEPGGAGEESKRVPGAGR